MSAIDQEDLIAKGNYGPPYHHYLLNGNIWWWKFRYSVQEVLKKQWQLRVALYQPHFEHTSVNKDYKF